MLNKQCLICKFIPTKLYKRMRLTTRLYGIMLTFNLDGINHAMHFQQQLLINICTK